MSIPNYEGKFFAINGGKLELFTHYWGLLDSEGDWVVFSPETSFLGFALTFSPKPIAEKIIKVIQDDTDAGKEDKIAYVAINPLVALQLWLEGVITRAHFETCNEAGEGSDEASEVYIELQDVVFKGKSRTVRIYAFPDYAYGTFDSEGSVV